MAIGACADCGNALEECECGPDRYEEEEEEHPCFNCRFFIRDQSECRYKKCKVTDRCNFFTHVRIL